MGINIKKGIEKTLSYLYICPTLAGEGEYFNDLKSELKDVNEFSIGGEIAHTALVGMAAGCLINGLISGFVLSDKIKNPYLLVAFVALPLITNTISGICEYCKNR